MKNLYILIAAVILLVGGGIYMTRGENTSESTGSEVSNEIEGANDDRKMSFSSFLNQGGSYQCDITQSVAGTETSGVAYISNGMIRGEYSTQAQGMTINSSLIVRDGFTYSWTSLAPNMGFKAKVVSGEVDSNTGTSGTYSFNADDIGSYECEEWTVDQSKFTLPAGVTFKEI